MGTYDNRSGSRSFSERQVSAALGVEVFELLLAASELRVGRHDPLTYLFVFTAEDAERLAARLKIPPAEVVRTFGKGHEEWGESALDGVSEPDAE